MKAIRQPTRGGILGKAKRNKHLHGDCITVRFSALNLFYGLVIAYWLVMILGAL